MTHPQFNDLYHDCLHPARVHKCDCGLGKAHTDKAWDEWYAAKEAAR